jgi:hypothetical protein
MIDDMDLVWRLGNDRGEAIEKVPDGCRSACPRAKNIGPWTLILTD